MVSLESRVPEEILGSLKGQPELFAAELRFAAAVHWYHQGLMSGSNAALIAGMSRLTFLDELARRRIDPLRIDRDQFCRELEEG